MKVICWFFSMDKCNELTEFGQLGPWIQGGGGVENRYSKLGNRSFIKLFYFKNWSMKDGLGHNGKTSDAHNSFTAILHHTNALFHFLNKFVCKLRQRPWLLIKNITNPLSHKPYMLIYIYWKMASYFFSSDFLFSMGYWPVWRASRRNKKADALTS